MLICIAILKNGTSTDEKKFRILDTDTGKVSDIPESNLKSKNIQIRNLAISDKRIDFIEGKEDKYPLISDSGVSNNIPIIISSDKYTVMSNYEGRVVKILTRDLLKKVKYFSNATVNGHKIEISKAQQNGKSSKVNYLDLILNAKDVPIDIQSFDMRDHYKDMGISDNVYKSPDRVFNTYSDGNKITNDTSAYSFEIVKVEDRVELRSYKGDNYTGLVVIPDKVTHICKAVFRKATATELIMPDTVIYLGENCFEYSKFKKIKLSKSVTAIPYCCFFDSDIQEINLENITSIDNMSFTKSKIREVRLLAPVIQIGYEAFKDCTSLEIFEHAKTIKKIRHNAFEGCIKLSYFDFESVTTIEQYAFSKTGLKKAILNGEIGYLQSSTFTGDIEEIQLLEGFEKVSAGAVSNVENKPITWTMPKSVKNIEKGAFTSQDIVMCYRKTIAASQAILAESQIVYLDDLDKSSIPNIIKKAEMLDTSVAEILENTLKKILNKGEFNKEYEIDESRLVRENIPSSILDLLGDDFSSKKYADDFDIANEKPKFKCILQHLSKVSKFDVFPFTSTILKLKDTFRISKKKNKFEVLYDDEVSTVMRITFVDNKFTSIDSSFIVAKTYDTLRYICMDNRYTDIMCENSDIYDLTELLKVLRPGDTIGLSSVISGVKYPEIYAKSDKEIEIKSNGRKITRKLEMNIYQALRYSSVTLKLDNNGIALLIPGNNVVIRCASLGKTVWLNEKEETYKSLQCTIESIEDISNNTVFDYESTYNSNSYGPLLKRFRLMNQSEYDKYIETYSHIYEAEQSMYKHAGDYAYEHAMKKVEDADLTFMLTLFKTSLFEERQESWLEDSKGKTIVADAKHEFELSDGSILYQYRAVRKTALRNKLMSGGDRKLYIFELVDSYGICAGVYLSLYDITTLASMCTEINDIDLDNYKTLMDKRIFENTERFDVVDYNLIIEVASLCRDNEYVYDESRIKFILAVFKPNGLYYIGVKIEYGKSYRFIPVIQVGEMDVALGFIEDSNKYGASNDSMLYLYKATTMILSSYSRERLGKNSFSYKDKSYYLGLLKARELCIKGVSDIASYSGLGLPEVLKRSLGYNTKGRDLYKKPEIEINISDSDLEMDYSEEGSNDSEEGRIENRELAGLIDNEAKSALSIQNMLQSNIGEDSFDINDEDFGDI